MISKTSILSTRPKTFDNSYRELQLSELTSISSYALLVLVAYRSYLQKVEEMAEGDEGFWGAMCRKLDLS